MITSAGGWFIQTIVQTKVKAQDFSIILCSEPVFATLFALWMGVGTIISSNDIIGGM